MAVWVESVGIRAPGLEGWDQAQPVLAGAQAYQPVPLPAPRTDLLAANERRRTTAAIRLALQTAEDAVRGSRLAADALCSVFASASGDLEIVDKICTALNLPERPVSPTQFHNSVHNAPAGYWSLGAASRMPSTSIAAHEHSFEAGLLEAWTTVEVEQQPVLLVAYEWPAPSPLQAHWPLQQAFAVALVLTPQPPAEAGLRLVLELSPGPVDTLSDLALEALRRGNPAARSLPLLAAIARGAPGRIRLPYCTAHSLSVQCHKR